MKTKVIAATVMTLSLLCGNRPAGGGASGNQKKTTDPVLTAAGQVHIYRGQYLGDISMPLGGIGAGCIEINGRAERHYWRIFNSFYRLHLPNSFFAVRAKSKNAKPVIRALQTSAVGPFKAMKNLSFTGEYPFGRFDFDDDKLPVKVGMEVFNPMIPMDEKDSAIPSIIFNLTAKNVTDKTVEVAFLAAQQNAVGFTGTGKIKGRNYKTYGKNRNGIIEQQGATVLYMFSDKRNDNVGYGDMALASPAKNVDGTASWENLDELKGIWSRTGRLDGCESAGPTPAGQTLDGALAVNSKIEPGKSRTVTFILTWYFPNAIHGFEETGWIHYGNMYANFWTNALDVARYVTGHLDWLTRKTRLFHDTLYASNLPHWLLDRLSSQFSILHSKTCFWAGDGYFGLWEGTNVDSGCCYGNCSHVYQYAQLHARLYPSIARRLREQALSYEKDDGNIPNRQPDGSDATDGQLGEILGCYREYLTGTDRTWLDNHWPKIKKAVEHAIAKWDGDADGVLAGRQPNTLDGNLGGSTSWLGTMYLAALEACEKMSLIESDTAGAERYRKIRIGGAEKQNKTLFNGEYYIQLPDPRPRQDYGNGCHIDQLLGQWWAKQLGLSNYYPADRIHSALQSIVKYNFKTNFRSFKFTERKFVDAGDAGTLMITWPGVAPPKPHIMYGNEVWTGTEYAAAATMIQNGMLKEGLMLVKAVADRHDGRQRRNIQYEGHSGNPFSDDESGKFYGRAMSVWSVLLACQGFIYDGPAQLIGFKPVWQPDNHCSFFTAAAGWGLFTQKRTASEQTDKIELKYGSLKLREFVFKIPTNSRPADITLLCDGKSTPLSVNRQGRQIHITTTQPIILNAGAALTVKITY